MSSQEKSAAKMSQRDTNLTDENRKTKSPADRQAKAAGAGKSIDPEQLKRQLEKTRQEAQDNYDRLLRVSAEFENFKKRTNKQVEDIRKFANENLLKELLNVVDNLERAVEAAKDNSSAGALLEGVNLTLASVRKLLERFKVQPVLALGEPFDPNFHQAMMQEESDDHPPNTVIRELQKGYLIHDRLLRPALVVVSKTGSQKGADAGGKESEQTN